MGTKERQDGEKIGEKRKLTGGWRQIATIGLSLFVGLGLFLLVYRKFDYEEFAEALRSTPIRYEYIVLTILIGALGNVFRGLRWRLQMEATSPPHARYATSILATLGSYTVSLIVPRTGEIWRGGVAHSYDRIPISRVAGTIVVDRVMDFVMLLVIALLALLLCYSDLLVLVNMIPFKVPSVWTVIQSWGFWAILVSCVLLFILLRKALSKKRFAKRIAAFKDDFVTAMKSVFTMPRKTLFLLYSLLIWLCYYWAFRLTFFAFPFTAELSSAIGLLAFIMGTLGVAVPVQAGIGTWHYMIITTLTVYGVTQSDAALFALVVHALQTLGTIFVGLIAILLVPLLNKKKMIS